MRKILVITMLAIGASGAALAALPSAPEIDPGSGASAIALLAGAVLVFRGRRRS